MVKRKTITIILSATIVIAMYLIWHISSYQEIHSEIPLLPINGTFKYILQWTKPFIQPFVYMGKGQDTFVKRRCQFNNCFITADRKFLNNITEFDVILFHGPELYRENLQLPDERSEQQKYVFVSMESSDYYPTCDVRFNGYFNWTWTYKLNSELYYGYMIIRDKDGQVIGPKEEMHWIDVKDMRPIDEEIKVKLNTKKRAAAWFVSNCNAPNGRWEVANTLADELHKNDMMLDIYGECGTKTCAWEKRDECLKMIEREYYFYLSFENSFSEDYVTEKLLSALQHYAIPIVYGDANYTRFLPDGTYLNAKKLRITELAKVMVELINDKEKYYEYFKWHNHYSYHNVEEVPETDSYCELCRSINDNEFTKQISVYKDFKAWWNPKKLREGVCGNKK